LPAVAARLKTRGSLGSGVRTQDDNGSWIYFERKAWNAKRGIRGAVHASQREPRLGGRPEAAGNTLSLPSRAKGHGVENPAGCSPAPKPAPKASSHSGRPSSGNARYRTSRQNAWRACGTGFEAPFGCEYPHPSAHRLPSRFGRHARPWMAPPPKCGGNSVSPAGRGQWAECRATLP
jgi:hypothetical protein